MGSQSIILLRQERGRFLTIAGIKGRMNMSFNAAGLKNRVNLYLRGCKDGCTQDF